MPDLMNKTIGQLLEEVAGKYPNNDAVVFPGRNLRYSYEAFDRHCRQVAKGLMKLGIEKRGPSCRMDIQSARMAVRSVRYRQNGGRTCYGKY